MLQQIEDFADAHGSANDCFRPVSRYFDRITRPEQILAALPRAMRVLTDPAECGPVTLACCQDVQAEAFDYPGGVLRAASGASAARRPTPRELADAAAALRAAQGAADHRRRRRALCGARTEALAAFRRPRTAFRSPRRRPARARCPTTIR